MPPNANTIPRAFELQMTKKKEDWNAGLWRFINQFKTLELSLRFFASIVNTRKKRHVSPWQKAKDPTQSIEDDLIANP